MQERVFSNDKIEILFETNTVGLLEKMEWKGLI